MKLEIKVFKKDKKYKVDFRIGNQSFELQYGGTKAEATWMAKMLKKAFSNLLEMK